MVWRGRAGRAVPRGPYQQMAGKTLAKKRQVAAGRFEKLGGPFPVCRGMEMATKQSSVRCNDEFRLRAGRARAGSLRREATHAVSTYNGPSVVAVNRRAATDLA